MDMSIAILLVQAAHPLASDADCEGLYLQTYDPDAMNGFGTFTATADLRLAMRFPDITEAMECWRQQSRVRPLRDDGKPNRPLTAFTITFETISD
jgi:hypothetical protein